jgi:DNA repair exonuclease SbcCD ATPase subunit
MTPYTDEHAEKLSVIVTCADMEAEYVPARNCRRIERELAEAKRRLTIATTEARDAIVAHEKVFDELAEANARIAGLEKALATAVLGQASGLVFQLEGQVQKAEKELAEANAENLRIRNGYMEQLNDIRAAERERCIKAVEDEPETVTFPCRGTFDLNCGTFAIGGVPEAKRNIITRINAPEGGEVPHA